MEPAQIFRSRRAVILRRVDLLAGGLTPRAIAAAVHGGTLRRVRIGHFALPGTDDGVIRAVRVGGLAAGLTATSAAGLWIPPRPRLHVWLPSNASRLRPPDAPEGPSSRSALHPRGSADLARIVRHWEQLDQEPRREAGAVALLDALRQVIETEPRGHAVAVLDSALSAGTISHADLLTVRGRLVRGRRSVLDELDPRSGSGSESLVRLALRDAGFAPRSQFAVPGVGVVDFLVGASVIVEVDSRAWHDAPHQRARDFERDLALFAHGFVVIRVDYQQALFDHPAIVRAVSAALVTARP